MTTTRAARYHRHGEPADVVRVEPEEWADPAAGEVRLEVRVAPINPVDLNVIQGSYPLKPVLPAVGGTEGVGIVVSEHRSQALPRGTPVLLPQNLGSWRESCVVPAAELVALPSDIDPDQAAMLRINPPTAWRMLRDFVELSPGDWIIQNGANSGVGRALIQIARELGIRTVNVVRRRELIEELLAEGGDVVLTEAEDLADQVATRTSRAAIQLALNGIGGKSALALANCVSPGGTVVTYGAMAREPLTIPNSLLIFRDLRWRGFWISKWYRRASAEELNEMFTQLLAMIKRGTLRAKVERRYPLEDVRSAILHAQQSGRSGKILLDLA